ncbi:MAG TPA: biotin/lipoyl-containing protein [bacterium]|nr:biotin/lipoyl-containing protein [bacterium]
MKNYRVTVNGQSYDVAVEEAGSVANVAQPAPAAQPAPIPQPVVQAAAPVAAVSAPSGAATIKAPMPGTVLSLKVSPGQSVKRGDVLLILEAMKMENEISAPSDGVVAAIRVQAGSTVNTGDPMVDLA